MKPSSNNRCALDVRAVSHDGRIVATKSPYGGKNMELFDVAKGLYLGRRSLEKGRMCFGSTPQIFFTSGKQVKCWNLDSGACLWTYCFPQERKAWQYVDFLPRLGLLLVGTCEAHRVEEHMPDDDGVILLDASTGAFVREIKPFELEFTSDEEYAANAPVLDGKTSKFFVDVLQTSDWRTVDRIDLGYYPGYTRLSVVGRCLLVETADRAGVALYLIETDGKLRAVGSYPELRSSRTLVHRRRQRFVIYPCQESNDEPFRRLEICAISGEILEDLELPAGSVEPRYGRTVLGDDYILDDSGTITDLDDGSVLRSGLFELIPDWPDEPVRWEF